jgi:RNA polymerase sigma-70 factor (ECF subfamily)
MTPDGPYPSQAGDDARDAGRALAGEVEAFEGIVRRWQGPLVNLAYRYCRDRGTAEELAQEAFLKVYRNLHRWRGEGTFSTWLFAVAVNVYRSWARKHRPPLASLRALEEMPSPADRRGLERREEERLVREAVRALPGKYRDAVLLYYFHDADLRRTAEILGRPEGTVKAHLHRARKLLERHLSPWLGLESAPETNRKPDEVPQWTGSTEL